MAGDPTALARAPETWPAAGSSRANRGPPGASPTLSLTLRSAVLAAVPLDAGQTRPWGGSATAACHPQGHRLPRAWPGQGWGAAPSLPAAAARAVECEGAPPRPCPPRLSSPSRQRAAAVPSARGARGTRTGSARPSRDTRVSEFLPEPRPCRGLLPTGRPALSPPTSPFPRLLHRWRGSSPSLWPKGSPWSLGAGRVRVDCSQRTAPLVGTETRTMAQWGFAAAPTRRVPALTGSPSRADESREPWQLRG